MAEPIMMPIRLQQSLAQGTRTAPTWCSRWHTRRTRASTSTSTSTSFALLRGLAGTATEQRLLTTDLHAGNVLAADREPWLVTDPKPYVGDPAYDPLQHLLNCPARLRAAPRAMVDRMAGLCEVDAERVRLWLFARCVVEWRSFDVEDAAVALAP